MKHLLPGDVILADRGFNIVETLAVMGATLDIPAFTRASYHLVKLRQPPSLQMFISMLNVSLAEWSNQQFEILSAIGVLPKGFIEVQEDGSAPL